MTVPTTVRTGRSHGRGFVTGPRRYWCRQEVATGPAVSLVRCDDPGSILLGDLRRQVDVVGSEAAAAVRPALHSPMTGRGSAGRNIAGTVDSGGVRFDDGGIVGG